MRLFRRYILSKWLKSFLCTYFTIVSLLLLEDVYKNFYLFVKAQSGFTELVKYYFFLSVSFASFVIPLAIFVSVLFALGQLHRKNEIIGARCAGMSILEISKPIIIGGIILALCNLLFESFIIPSAIDYVTTFRLKTDLRGGYATIAPKMGFYNHVNNRLWFFKSLNKLSHTAKDVTISCYNDKNVEESRIFAQTATFSKDKKYWICKNCSVIIFDPKTELPTGVKLFAEKAFETFAETPKIMLASLKKPKDLSLSEVLEAIKYCRSEPAENVFWVKFHQIFANAADCMIILFLAIPFAVMGIRVNPCVNIARASGFLLIFLFCGTICETLGSNGILRPALAAWITNILILLPIIKLFRRAM
ncbi:MAG: LptF/LptG family permease [Puniceicoccales bacterium]|jgi:lipopolysaccharide export system permease protein|nr:LptF/LptG family permease [Puniceicoccales bacterium]